MQLPIKAVIFDLDGVIINSNPVIETFWKSWTDRESITLTDAMICEWIYGRKVGDTISGIFNHLPAERKKEIEVSAYEFDSTMQPEAVGGVVALIHFLSAVQVPIGVATSSHHPRMLAMLERIAVDHHFTHFITAHDVTHGKPHPEPYRKMAEKMNTAPDQCLVFEDAISGVQSAKAAGMYVIGIGNAITGPSLTAYGATDIIPDFSSLVLNDQQLITPNGTVINLT